jgi:hypothetical protein
MHITMVIKNARYKIVQCVIDDSFKADFEALGFVDHADKLKSKATKTKPTKAKTNA